MIKKIGLCISLLIGVICANAQRCKTCYYFSENARIETVTTLPDGKLKEREVTTISNVKTSGNEITSTLSSVKYDKNGKAGEPGTAKIQCTNDGLRISFSMPVMDDKEQQPKELYLSYPDQMQKGQQLESNVEFVINGKVKGKKLDVIFKITDRKVVGNEELSTPMGRLPCTKISFNMDIQFKILGVKMPMKLLVYEWYAPGVGVVRTESYKDGKLAETAVVTVKR